MSTISGFIGGIIFTIIALVVFAKPLASWAAKRSMRNLLGNVQGQINELAAGIPEPLDPEKLIEDNNVKEKRRPEKDTEKN